MQSLPLRELFLAGSFLSHTHLHMKQAQTLNDTQAVVLAHRCWLRLVAPAKTTAATTAVVSVCVMLWLNSMCMWCVAGSFRRHWCSPSTAAVAAVLLLMNTRVVGRKEGGGIL